MTVASVIKINSSKGEPNIIMLLDVSSCFDKCRTTDIIYDAVETEVDKRALFMLGKMNERMLVHVNGDLDNSRMAELVDTCGQGTNFAPHGISLSIRNTTDEAIPMENNVVVGV